MKRVLMTGATGFIGRSVIEPLRSRGFDVHTLGRRAPAGVGADEHHHADLLEAGNAEGIIRELRPTHLLHLAWYAEHGKFWSASENLHWVGSTLRLLEAFVAAGGRRAVFAGTCAEYDWSHGWLSEGVTPERPSSIYGASKDATRRIVEAFARAHDLSWAWGRIFFLYGPGEAPTRLVASIARNLLAGTVAACSTGHQVRDFSHVLDVASAFAALLDSEVRGPVNIASGAPHSVRDVALRLGELVGRLDLLNFGAVASPAHDPPFLVADVRRLHEEARFSPRFDLDTGLRSALEAWREQWPPATSR